MRIQHNLQSMNSNRQLGITTQSKAKSSEKLSSGYKINRAADDAAGLTISEKMRKQVRGLTRGSDNSMDGISMVQTADGAMAEIHDMLHRGTELSIQAANGTMSFDDRMACQREIDQIIKEIDAIQERTYFNEIPVLKGDVVLTLGKVLVPPTDTGQIVMEGENLPQWMLDGIDGQSRSAGTLANVYTTTANISYDVPDPNDPDQLIHQTGTIQVDHPASYMDFSGFDPANIDELNGKGFYTTCCTCSNHYSIEFDTESTESTAETSGNHFIYKIGIQGIQSADNLINKIIRDTGGIPGNHYTQLAKDGNKLVVYDGRTTKTQQDFLRDVGYTGELKDVKNVSYSGWPIVGTNIRPVGLFGPGVAKAVLTPAIYEKNKVLRNKNANVHAGAEADLDNKIYIKLPNISSKALGLDDVHVTDALDAYYLRDPEWQNEPDLEKKMKLYRSQRKFDTQDPAQRNLLMALKGPAERAIDSFNEALAYVSAERSRMGAYQNRLEHTIKNLDNIVENTTSAESRLRDTDMADEMVKLSMQNILQQAGHSVLAQANQTPQGVMSLLQG